MSARSLMVQRAQVLRNANAGQRDRNNQPAVEDFQPLVLAYGPTEPVPGRLPCFLWSVRERQIDGPVNALIEVQHLGIPADAPITPADRIDGVYDRAGVRLAHGLYRITGDQRMGGSHRELTLELVAAHAGAAS
jgi:hypothetical protein